MIVIEDCEVRSEAASPLDDSTFGIVLSFGGGQLQHLATYTEVRQFTLGGAVSVSMKPINFQNN